MNLDWTAIRPLNGSQAAGFEELCAQLARAESPAGAKFERKGTPDAGVECFCALSDDTQWGWQAKYCTTLGDSQFAQLHGSVKTALSRHSSLTRYFVCVPLDRPDARVDGKKSAMERWNERVSKWERWARESGRNVDFVWWGSSELIERLARTEHVGRVFFWFGQRGFDQSWFNARLREALDSAGPRYTPPVHVDLPIAKDLECFGRTASSLDAVKAQAIPLRKALQMLHSAGSDQDDPSRNVPTEDLRHSVNAALGGFAALSPDPTGELPLQTISEHTREAESVAWNYHEIAVLLSVRSTYADVIVPEEVHRKAAVAVHHGFVDHEYDAARIFFSHYGLELPSTPILQPEFRNPLFLKTICQGLRDDGQRLLPRGLHGISAAFELNWTGRGADFVDRESNLAAFDPTAHADGPTALLVRDDLLRRYLNESDMALCWTVIGEKRIIGREANRLYQGALHISGAYTLGDDGRDGFLKFRRDRLDQRDETGAPNAADTASTSQDAGSSPDSSDTPAREATPDGTAEAEGTET